MAGKPRARMFPSAGQAPPQSDCGRFNFFLVRQENTMKTLLALLMSSVFVVLAGCNTVAGAGKDIERGGEKVQDTAKDVQEKM